MNEKNDITATTNTSNTSNSNDFNKARNFMFNPNTPEVNSSDTKIYTNNNDQGVNENDKTTKKPTTDHLFALFGHRPLEDIISDWNAQIDHDRHLFMDQALLVTKWDKMINQNVDMIQLLIQNLDRVASAQSMLEQNLELATSQQKDLEKILVNLEKKIEQWPLPQDLTSQDKERKKGYQLAENINSQLDIMSNKLKDLVSKFNLSQKDQENDLPIFQVIQIMNEHLNTLQWIDHTTEQLGKKINEMLLRSVK